MFLKAFIIFIIHMLDKKLSINADFGKYWSGKES